MHQPDRTDAARALLRWYLDAGVDEAVAADPVDRFQPPVARPTAASQFAPTSIPTGASKPASRPAPVTVINAPAQPGVDEAVALAVKTAAACATHEELAAAVAAFEACPLKAGARNTVFADGVAGAPLLVIGEAPGRDEDAAGKPFIGRAGQLLDRMLAAIGRSRQTNALISNVVYWRPPGNRAPTHAEIAVCRPFVERLITLTAPRAILLAGGAPTQALVGATSIMRARGTWTEIVVAGRAFPALPTLHPAFLLRQPAQKRLAWADLQALAARLRED